MPEKRQSNWRRFFIFIKCAGLFCLLFFNTGADGFWNEDRVNRYVKKKLRFNPDTLRIRSKPLDDRGLSYLAGMPALKTVTTLVLYEIHPGVDGIRALSRSRFLKNLKHLSLEKSGLTNESLKVLTQSPLFQQLETLNLYRNQIGDESIRELVDAAPASSLKELNLSFNRITVEGAQSLTQSTYFIENLRNLVMTGNPLGPAGEAACEKFNYKIEFRELKKKRRLPYLQSHYIGDLGLEALLETDYLLDLQELNLEENNLSDEAVRLLAQSPKIRSLKILNLSRNQIHDDGIKSLARSPHLENLEQLILDYNFIGDEGAQTLAGASELRNLKKLSLKENQIGPLGAEALENSLHLKNLKFPIFGFH